MIVLIGPTALFLQLFGVQMEEHVKAWRWFHFLKGDETPRNHYLR